ncbi:cytochrome c [Mesorhizobium sp. M1409]|uniref:cytochrome c n=1 Tax=unclassified Mesorhizobium TaxID=325217 RepID=UPI003335FBC4
MTRFHKAIYSVAVVAVICAAGAAAFFFWPHGLNEVSASSRQPTGTTLVERGRYLTVAADCAACHTAKGGKPFAGGVAFALPFGEIFSSNITPDPVEGIGAWSDAEFVRAVKAGVGKHGEDLYPAFPYASYALLSDDDVLAIRAYLSTLQPVAAASRPSELAFPFNQRYLMRAWKILFVPHDAMKADLAHDQQWNTGAYLVEALAHCGECHTPRGLMFQRVQSKALSGAEVDGWKAWNITSDNQTGIGWWTDGEIADYLASGHSDGHGSASGSMREAVDLSLSKLPKTDIEAIVAYLRTVPAVSTGLSLSVDRNIRTNSGLDQISATSDDPGRKLFAGACAACHGWDALGKSNPRAAIDGAHSFADPKGANLLRVILQGSSNEERRTGETMPAFAPILSDVEVAQLANFVLAHFGETKGSVRPADVRAARGPVK